MNTNASYTQKELGKLAFSLKKEKNITQKEAYALAKQMLTEQSEPVAEAAELAPAPEVVELAVEDMPVATTEPSAEVSASETETISSAEVGSLEDVFGAPLSESEDAPGTDTAEDTLTSLADGVCELINPELPAVTSELINALKAGAVKFKFIGNSGREITTTGTLNEEKVPKCTREITGPRTPKSGNMTIFFDIRHGVRRQFDNNKVIAILDADVRKGRKRGTKLAKKAEVAETAPA